MKKIITFILMLMIFALPAYAVDPRADRVKTDTTTLNNNIPGCSDVQSCLEAVDNLSIAGSSLNVVNKTANFTLTSANDVVLGDTSSGSFTLTLPTAVGVTKPFTLKRIGTGTNNLTVGTTSAQTIDGDTTQVLTITNTSIDVVSDGSNWRIK